MAPTLRSSSRKQPTVVRKLVSFSGMKRKRNSHTNVNANSLHGMASSSITQKQARQFLVLCEVCKNKKHEAVKFCINCKVSFCKIHLEPHQNVSSYKKHKLIDPLENVKDYMCRTHERPLEMFCRTDQICICRICIETDHKNHNIVSIEEERKTKERECKNEQAEVEKLIQDRLKKIQELQQSVEEKKKNTEKEKANSMKIFSPLIRSIEMVQTEMVTVTDQKQRSAEHQSARFIRDLEHEITELKRRNTELEKICNTEDHLHLLKMYSIPRPPPTNNWTDVRIQNHLDVETLRRKLSQLQRCFEQVMVKLASLELKRIQQYAVDVILDPDTAHRYLILSDDGKQVTYTLTEQDRPNNQKRFDQCPCVLGSEGFSSGRFYYEVQVKGKTEWEFGVTTESSNRKGKITLSPEEGFWSVWLRNKTEYEALDSPPAPLLLKPAPQKLGVFVDYDEGLVSFYDVENESHIYTFTGETFTEKLYPYFCPGLNNYGGNASPLIICPDSQA